MTRGGVRGAEPLCFLSQLIGKPPSAAEQVLELIIFSDEHLTATLKNEVVQRPHATEHCEKAMKAPRIGALDRDAAARNLRCPTSGSVSSKVLLNKKHSVRQISKLWVEFHAEE